MGRSRRRPRIGSRLKKPRMVGKKPLKSAQNPYASRHMPTRAHLIRINTTPARKKADPCRMGMSMAYGKCISIQQTSSLSQTFQFFFLIKNRSVALGPMVVATPARNSSCTFERLAMKLMTYPTVYSNDHLQTEADSLQQEGVC